MNPFTWEDLQRLATPSNEPAVSIYMPTHRAGRDVRENETRFKNLLKRAVQRTADQYPDDPHLQARLQEAATLKGDDEWWQHQSDGLAIFLSAGTNERYRIPMAFAEFVSVCPRFQVRPMIRLLQGDGRFYILAVSQRQVRLLEGSRYMIEELDAETLPTDLRSALNIDEHRSSLQQHSTGGPNTAGTMIFHGHGASDMDGCESDGDGPTNWSRGSRTADRWRGKTPWTLPLPYRTHCSKPISAS